MKWALDTAVFDPNDAVERPASRASIPSGIFPALRFAKNARRAPLGFIRGARIRGLGNSLLSIAKQNVRRSRHRYSSPPGSGSACLPKETHFPQS